MTTYPCRAGLEKERLELIWETYNYFCNSTYSKGGYDNIRWSPIAWDFAQIAGAIAGGYKVRMSPQYKGIQVLKRNKILWEKVQKFIVVEIGLCCIPDKISIHGWEKLNNIPSGAIVNV